jgi:hypothetical protein
VPACRIGLIGVRYAYRFLVTGLGAPVSQDAGNRGPGNELRVALRMFMSDLHTAAYEAVQLADEADLAESAPRVTDAARLQGFDDNLAYLQSLVIKDPGLFSSLSVPDFLMLDRLNVLRSQAQRVIALSDRSGLCGYFEDAIGLMDLLADQPGVKEIKFFLGTLRLALREKPPLLLDAEPESPAGPASEASPRQVKIFLVASEAGQAAAEELAGLLRKRKHGVENVQVTQSWDLVGELSQQPLVTARSAVARCHYGALVLVADEATVDPNSGTAGNIFKGRLRLSADVEFLLGLMVGVFGVQFTFMVLPEPQSEQPELATLLVGLTKASYVPANLGQNMAMSQACNEIMNAVRIQEKNTGRNS